MFASQTAPAVGESPAQTVQSQDHPSVCRALLASKGCSLLYRGPPPSLPSPGFGADDSPTRQRRRTGAPVRSGRRRRTAPKRRRGAAVCMIRIINCSKLGPPIRPRMPLAYRSQLLADRGLTSAVSSSTVQLSSRSNSICAISIADSADSGQAFRLKADSESGRSRTAFR
jgi:hypothetical protein